MLTPVHAVSIRIWQNGNQQAVSARELYAYLEIKTKRFDIWMSRMLEYGFSQNADYQCLYKNVQTPTGGQKQALDDYALTIDCAKEIAMIQRTDKGKQARLYFIECEKQLKEKECREQQEKHSRDREKLKQLRAANQSLRFDNARLTRKLEAAEPYLTMQKSLLPAPSDEQQKWRKYFFRVLDGYVNGTYNAKDPDEVMKQVFRKLETDYRLHLDSLPRYYGEHLVDVAYRNGYGQQVYEVLAFQLPYSKSIKIQP